MATANLNDVLRRLVRGMDAELSDQDSDRQLVRRALAERDAAALQAIVHRHGAMVYRVCWRVLQHTQDAEDAFQATFLVLAQKLRTLRKHASLASWLHGVAYRMSVRAKQQANSRRRRESRASLSDAMPPDDVTWKELRSALDAALSQLPDKWRLPLVLCYLEGRTQEEAAKRLAWSKSTLRSRLEDAREALARRLTRRGFTLPAALSAVLLSDCAASAAPAAGLVAQAVEAAADVAAGKMLATATSATVAALTQGAIKAMFTTKLKIISVALVATCALAAIGVGTATFPALQARPGAQRFPEVEPKSGQQPAPKPNPDVETLVKQLGDPDFATREAATKKLRVIGMKALPELQAGTRDPSLEVKKRSQELLATIRADARDALAKQFDPQKSEEYDHPVWKRFVAIAGDSKASRELFALIIANAKWLRALDDAEADPPAAGRVYRVGIAEVFRDYNNDTTKSPFWPCDRPEEVAYLMLLGSHPDPNPPAKLTADEVVPTNARSMAALGRGIIHGEGQILHANGLDLGLKGKIRFFYTPEIVGAPGTDRVFVRLFAAWLAERPASSEVLPRGFHIARRFPEILPLARRYAANDFDPKRDVPPLVTIKALELVAQLGTRADLPLFERHFGDETNVAAVDKPRSDGHWDYDRPAPLTETTQLRDVALGLALLLYGANPEDFGFLVRKDTFKQKDGRYTIPWTTQLHLGFESDANRTAAFKKAKAWLKSFEPPPAPKPDPDVEKLVKQLGDPDFATREAATKKLRAIGMTAIPALKAGTRDPSLEVRKRSQELLSAIRADARDALAKQFDPKKTEEYDHPVWKHFVSIAGDSKASRELFARIIANEKWLRTLDNAEGDPEAAGHVYRVGIAEMFRDFHNDPAKSPPWPCDLPEEVAYLLLLGSYPEHTPPAKLTGDEIVPPNLRGVEFLGRGIIFGEGQIIHANGISLGLQGKIRFFNAPEIVGAPGTDRVFGKLFAAWLAQRPPSAVVVSRGFLIASDYRVPELLPLARRYAANDLDPKRDIPPLATIKALELVAQLGTRSDLPLFERHFGDNTNVAAVDKPGEGRDYFRPEPITKTTQLRDVALGLALLLHGASPEDFGFLVRKDTFKQKDGRYTIPRTTQLHLGFKSDEDRAAAFKKAKAWLAEQKSKVEPPGAPKPAQPGSGK